MKIDWGKAGLAAGAVGLMVWMAKASKPQGIKGLVDFNGDGLVGYKTDTRALVMGGATALLGAGAIYALFFHDWEKKNRMRTQ